MSLSEFNIIEKYFAKRTRQRKDVSLGIGDDAAILQVPNDQELVVAIDTLVEGVHFPEDTIPYDIGHKALAVNLSDIAAMGAEPAWATLALTLPYANPNWLDQFCDGLFNLLDEYSMQLIGGDLTQGPLTISIQAHGFVPKGQAVRRDGAKVGDKIYVSGCLGEAAIALYEIPEHYPLAKTALLLFLQKDLAPRLNRPQPRIHEGIALRNIASSMIDISDGLAADLGHILSQSHVGAHVKCAKLPINSKCYDHFTDDEIYQFALTGGDDYELCFTIPAEKQAAFDKISKQFACGFTCIGEIEDKPGLRITKADGTLLDLKEKGYEHFGRKGLY